MSIPLENMVAYIASRPASDGTAAELYLDNYVRWKNVDGLPVVEKPDNCCGILYCDPATGKLRVEYPE